MKVRNVLLACSMSLTVALASSLSVAAQNLNWNKIRSDLKKIKDTCNAYEYTLVESAGKADFENVKKVFNLTSNDTGKFYNGEATTSLYEKNAQGYERITIGDCWGLVIVTRISDSDYKVVFYTGKSFLPNQVPSNRFHATMLLAVQKVVN